MPFKYTCEMSLEKKPKQSMKNDVDRENFIPIITYELCYYTFEGNPFI